MTARVSPQVGLNPPPQWFGTYLATVVNTRPTDQAAQLQIPQVLGTAVSNWALPVGQANAPGGVSPGTIVAAMFVGGNINVPVWLPYNTAAQVVPPAPDTPHSTVGQGQNSFTLNPSGFPGMQYWMGTDNFVNITGAVSLPGTYNNETFLVLPEYYWPNSIQAWPITVAAGQTTGADLIATPMCQVDTAGNMQLHNLPLPTTSPTTTWASNVMYVGGRYPSKLITGIN